MPSLENRRILCFLHSDGDLKRGGPGKSADSPPAILFLMIKADWLDVNVLGVEASNNLSFLCYLAHLEFEES